MATFNLMTLNFLAPAQTAFLSCRCSEPQHLSGMFSRHLPLKVYTSIAGLLPALVDSAAESRDWRPPSLFKNLDPCLQKQQQEPRAKIMDCGAQILGLEFLHLLIVSIQASFLSCCLSFSPVIQIIIVLPLSPSGLRIKLIAICKVLTPLSSTQTVLFVYF